MNFKLNNKMIIGAVHFNPLIGYEGFVDYQSVFDKAKQDLRAFEDGGVDAIIFENNYNFPHKINESYEVLEMMISLINDLSKLTKLPYGVSLLWNDYLGAFRIAKKTNAKFIRVPVFVDDVKTDFGIIYAHPKKVIEARKSLDAEQILILADIHVKHAEMLDKKKTLTESALEAKNLGADGIIITGKWTGDAPIIKDLSLARESVGPNFPIIVGSGANKENISNLFKFATCAIVSTSLKEGDSIDPKKERNLKPYSAKVDVSKVIDLMNKVKYE